MPRKIEKQVALDRALTVFWDHEYRGTSMDMLTERLGVEKPSIYASFGSKHKLYLNALGHYRVWLIASVRHIVSAAPSARAANKRNYNVDTSDNRGIVRWLGNTSHSGCDVRSRLERNRRCGPRSPCYPQFAKANPHSSATNASAISSRRRIALCLLLRN